MRKALFSWLFLFIFLILCIPRSSRALGFSMEKLIEQPSSLGFGLSSEPSSISKADRNLIQMN